MNEATAAAVLVQHILNGTANCCSCGKWGRWGQPYDERIQGFADHLADTLGAAGLLSTVPTRAEEWRLLMQLANLIEREGEEP